MSDAAFTTADARLLRVLAVLVAALPPEKRARHLAARCEDLAARIETAIHHESPNGESCCSLTSG